MTCSTNTKRVVYTAPAITGTVATVAGFAGYNVSTGTAALAAAGVGIGGFVLLVISSLGCIAWLTPKQTMAGLTARISGMNRELSGQIFPLNDTSQNLENLYEKTRKERDELKEKLSEVLLNLKNTTTNLQEFQQKLEVASLQLKDMHVLLEECKAKEKEHLEIIFKLKEVLEHSIRAVEEGNVLLKGSQELGKELEEGVTQFDKENNEFLENLRSAKNLVEEVIEHTNKIEGLDQSNKELVLRAEIVRRDLDKTDDEMVATSLKIKEDLENTQKLHDKILELIHLIVDAKSFESIQPRLKRIQEIFDQTQSESPV